MKGPESAEIGRGDLLRWGDDVRAAVNRIDRMVADDVPLRELQAKGDLKAGDHCRFCPLKVECPEIASQAARLAGIVFSDEPEPLSPPTDIADILKWAPVLEDWLKSARKEAEARMIKGEGIKGWKVVRRRSVRTWRPDLSAEDIESKVLAFGILHEDLYGAAEDGVRPRDREEGAEGSEGGLQQRSARQARRQPDDRAGVGSTGRGVRRCVPRQLGEVSVRSSHTSGAAGAEPYRLGTARDDPILLHSGDEPSGSAENRLD